MKVKFLICTGIVLLVVAGVAMAKTNKLTGALSHGDGSVNLNSAISLKVELNSKGKPTKMKDIVVKKASYHCTESDVHGGRFHDPRTVPRSRRTRTPDCTSPRARPTANATTTSTHR